MGQQEVIESIKGKKEFLTAEEIAKVSRQSYSCAIRALQAMFKYKEVERKIIKEKRYNLREIFVWRAI